MSSSHLSISTIIDLIPFVSQLKETFFKWVSLDCYNRIHLKLIDEQIKNLDVKSIISALERWDDMQNYGAPGVEMESVVCDENTLLKIVNSSAALNKIILDMMADLKNAEDLN